MKITRPYFYTGLQHKIMSLGCPEKNDNSLEKLKLHITFNLGGTIR